MGKQTKTLRARDSERGAALITVVLMAMLLLMAGGALIAVTSSSASLAADATSESQAYYAAEAGAQEVMSVLRGNAPPLFNVDTVNAANNKMTFRKAVTLADSNSPSDTTGKARLSRWISYSATSSNGTSVVPVSTNYTAASGMAFAVDEIKDPDNSDVVVFSTSGVFGTSPSLPSGLSVTYTPRSSTTVSTYTSSSTNLGSFSVSVTGGNGTYTATNVPFTLTVTQTAPWAATKDIACTLSGVITKTGSNLAGTLLLTFPANTYSLDDVDYTITGLVTSALTISASSSTTVNTTLTAPEPQRLRVRVTGYGPRNAVKMMQMLVSRFAFDFNATGTITLRSHDDNSTALHGDIGSSSAFNYNGNDNANGPSLPAFTVTGDQDVAFINGINSSNSGSGSQVQGNPGPARKIAISSLDKFLQTTDGYNGARATLDRMRQAAKNLKTPGCSDPNPDVCDRYYASGETPSNIGLGMTDGITTFVDGDYEMPPAGGAGLLIVTGTLTMRGNADFKGLILVLGDGHVERDGGGGDTSLGSMAIARFGSSGGFLEPTYNVQGGGNSTMRYDSEWVRKALKTAGPGVLGISEY